MSHNIFFSILLLSLCCQTGYTEEFVVLAGAIETHYKTYVTGQTFKPDEAWSIKARKPDTTVCPIKVMSEQGCLILNNKTSYTAKMITESSNKEDLWDRLKELFIPNTVSMHGAKRWNKTETIPYFPSGTLLKPENQLLIELMPEDIGHFSDFKLYRQGSSQPIVSQRTFRGRISIPAKLLNYDTRYEWTVRKNSKLRQGGFIIAREVDQQNFEKNLRTIPHFKLLPVKAQQVLRAMEAKRWDYTYDMNQSAQAVITAKETHHE